MNDKIIGRNPVLEAIRSGRSVDKILVKKGKYEGSIVPIIKKAKDAGIIIQEVERAKLDQIAEGENHQGVIAYVSAYDYVSVKDILDKAREKNEPPFVIICDKITDPHNLGAILRTANCVGAHGVIINITSSPDIGLEDVETAAGLITQSAHPDANIIWGTAFDENLSDEMRVTVVATGFDNKSASDLRNSINNAMGGAQSVPSAVFSSDTGASAAPASNAAPAAAPAEKKAVEEESSDNRYYDELLAILNKRK